VFFSVAGTKLPSYLFPAFPALALLVGAAAISNGKPTTENRPVAPSPFPSPPEGERTEMRGELDQLSVVGCRFSIDASHAPAWLAKVGLWLIGLTGGAMAAGAGSVPLILERLRPLARGVLDEVALPLGVAWWLAGLLAVGTMISLLVRGQRRLMVLAAMMGLVILTAEVAMAPQAYAILQGPLREFAEEARGLLGSRGTLVVYGLNAPSIVFYADHRVMPLGPGSATALEDIRRIAEADPPVVVITRKVHTPRLNEVPGLFRLKSRGGYAIYCSACQMTDNLKFQTDN
jgi:4-amino-4-deoxy-L-arabinose transferase-like glycosyltransferase